MCPLCRSLFIGPCTPKKLPCGHTVCIKCLNKYAELHDSKCVLCSRPYGVQPCELPTDLEIQRTAKEFDEANDKIGQKEKEPEKEKSKYNLWVLLLGWGCSSMQRIQHVWPEKRHKKRVVFREWMQIFIRVKKYQFSRKKDCSTLFHFNLILLKGYFWTKSCSEVKFGCKTLVRYKFLDRGVFYLFICLFIYFFSKRWIFIKNTVHILKTWSHMFTYWYWGTPHPPVSSLLQGLSVNIHSKLHFFPNPRLFCLFRENLTLIT